MDLLAPHGPLLLVPTEWGVWGAENWHLYETVRRSGGSTSSLKAQPCHYFESNEREHALDFLYLFVLFSWDVYAFAYRENDLLFLSHDGFVTYFSPARTAYVKALLEERLEAPFGIEGSIAKH
jgi:hypothetical protein